MTCCSPLSYTIPSNEDRVQILVHLNFVVFLVLPTLAYRSFVFHNHSNFNRSYIGSIFTFESCSIFSFLLSWSATVIFLGDDPGFWNEVGK